MSAKLVTREYPTWPSHKRCSYCLTTGRPSTCGMCQARNEIDRLNTCVEEAQQKSRRYDEWFEKGRCPACHFMEKHLVSCPIAILEGKITRAQELLCEVAKRLDGTLAQDERQMVVTASAMLITSEDPDKCTKCGGHAGGSDRVCIPCSLEANPIGPSDVCPKCEGRGFIVGVLPSEPPCPVCKGSGKRPSDVCGTCGYRRGLIHERCPSCGAGPDCQEKSNG